MLLRIFLILLLLPFSSTAKEIEFDLGHLKKIDNIINEEIIKGNIPGAVILVGKGNKTVFLKAYGNRRTYKKTEKMTIDTVFDIASITKPIATASSIWKLVEMGKIRLWDRVSMYVPEFKKSDNKTPLRIYHLMTHTSGLAPSYNKKTLLKKYQKPQLKDLINEIAILKREKLPGESFVYSCLGYIVLGHIVEKISGQNLSKFAEENIFSKLEMWSTKFIPKDSIKKRISPTEVLNGNLSIGIVHDPLAQIIGGISGNAGLFSTAEDMAKFARMLLNNGYYKDKKIFSQHTVKAFTIIYPQLKKFGRSPGWDVNTIILPGHGDFTSIGQEKKINPFL